MVQKSQIGKQMVFPEGKLGEIVRERFWDTNWARIIKDCGWMSKVPTVVRKVLDCDRN
jgi:hypothetical protein